jgi:hypothetical protein
VGCFLLYEVSSGDEKGIDFLPKRVSSAVMFFQSLVLEVAKKYIIAKSSFCGSGDTAAFFQKKLIFQRPGRTKISSSTFKKEVEDFSQRLGKTGRFFRCLQKLIGILSGKEKHSL